MRKLFYSLFAIVFSIVFYQNAFAQTVFQQEGQKAVSKFLITQKPSGPLPKGCVYDFSEVDTVIVKCKGGNPKTRLHATIRCADKYGLVKIRVGNNISAANGTSVAKCDYRGWGEHGPYNGPATNPFTDNINGFIRGWFPLPKGDE